MADPIDTPRPSTAGPPSETPLASFFAANGGMFDAGAVDDAPTIISKGQPRSPRPEDTFAHTLRGRRLSHFDLIEPIGVGGMAAVIRAQDTQLDRSVALKILPPDMAADPENIRRFQQEARAAAKLDHENIARVYFFGEDQGLHFIAFEFVEGENLRLLLEHRGRLPIPEAVHYMLQIATGLAHAAERGVVHRDIKPSNIIIGPSGRAKLVDMGLARSMAPVGDIELTQSGVTLGTFDYISPEQALEPRMADVRSDIYSMGCTFYQALTGQPPVPEGTAAKKLHHHQHVAPVDPRQMNSAVPDELAAILGRMMAKDPRERYQRPEHLVQHLLQLAQKLGAGGHGADGVLFVDAPLPAPPRMRPMIVAAVAASLLIMLVVLHGMSSWPSSSRTGPGFGAARPKDPGTRTNDNGEVVKTPGGLETTPPIVAPSPTPTTRARVDVASAHELALALTRPGDIDIFLLNDIELVPTRGVDPGKTPFPETVFAGGKRELTIQPKQAGKRAAIKLTFNADLRAEDPDRPVVHPLSFDGGRVKISGVRFEVDCREAPYLMIAPLRVRQGAALTLENCEFVQRGSPAKGRVADVVVEGTTAREALPSVTARECTFISDLRARTSEVIALSGAARVVVTNCAFGPHAAVVHLRERASEAADVRLIGCSALITDGTVFQLDELSGRFLVQHSLFSRPASPDELPVGGGVLIRQEGSGSVDSFTGQRNRYHNLSAFWARSPESATMAEDWDRFRAVPGVNDVESGPLDVSPWSDKDPLRALESGDLARAFRADARNAELRQTGGERMIGVEVCSWGKVYNSLPPLDDRRKLVVDPSATIGGDATVKIFSKLEQAVLEARPGEEILVRKTGELSVEPIRLDKPNVDLTIRPYNGYHPVLVLGDSPDKDVSMFRLQDGKLKLEELQFRLKPRAREGKDEMQAVIGIAGQGHCQFKRCVFTLGNDSGGEGASLSVVALADPKDVMKMGTPAPRAMPEMFFENCFARGRGSFVGVRASRPFELRADNCIAALNGSFCNVEASTAKELPATAAQITLGRLTGVFSGNLLQLHTSREAKDLVPVVVRASECVFSASAGQPLVHIDGEVSQVTKRTLTWEGRRNVYLNFKQLLDQSKGEENTMGAFNKDKWVAFTNENDALFEGIRFLSAPPTTDRALLDTVPLQFRLKAEDEAELRAGADPTRLLTPLTRGRPAPVSAADE
jgi:serine/threonine protein kinase